MSHAPAEAEKNTSSVVVIIHNHIRCIMKNILLIILFVIIPCGLFAADSGNLFMPSGANFAFYSRGSDTFILTQSHLTHMQIDKTMSQLASGKRIVTASDDPAGLAVAEKMESLLRGIKQDAMNDEDMKNYYNYAESVIAQDQEILQRIRELVVQSLNGILHTDDKEIIQTEINELLLQIDMNSKFSQFNKIRVIPELTVDGLGLDKIDVIRNKASLDVVDKVLTNFTRKRVLLGVKSNVLSLRIEGKNYNYINLLKSQSGITDLEMEQGVTELMKNNILLKTQNGLLVRPAK